MVSVWFRPFFSLPTMRCAAPERYRFLHPGDDANSDTSPDVRRWYWEGIPMQFMRKYAKETMYFWPMLTAHFGTFSFGCRPFDAVLEPSSSPDTAAAAGHCAQDAN